jgi:hypothetical protein
MTKDEMQNEAIAVLRDNDRGSYTVPTSGLYPFQWNWDSCLTALGQRHYDEARGWTEIETLFAHQWLDGMVPHIVFHTPDEGYFPGPNVWRTGRPVPTSGITQPPVAGFAVGRLLAEAKDPAMARQRAAALLPAIDAWHRWFFAARDPNNEGLVAILHPWESGRDNSVDWDEAFARVPTDGVEPYRRRDTQHADPSQRPTAAQYDRYLWLVQHFRGLGWDNSKLHDASPFRLVDPGFNAILIRSCLALAAIGAELGEPALAARNRAWAERGIAALDGLWSEVRGQYLCRDRITGKLVDSPSIGGLMTAFAPIPGPRLAALASTIERQATVALYLVASHDPADPRFESRRYWRGPSWLVTNYMIADGLLAGGQRALAQRIISQSLETIEQSGFAEYYDPVDATPCGGGHFSWTAAMALELMAMRQAAGGAHG